MNVFLVIIGGMAIAVGIFGKNFYTADILSLALYRQKSSTWSGRLVFIVVGIGFVAMGIKLLIGAE
jgi:hypothetical protein